MLLPRRRPLRPRRTRVRTARRWRPRWCGSTGPSRSRCVGPCRRDHLTLHRVRRADPPCHAAVRNAAQLLSLRSALSTTTCGLVAAVAAAVGREFDPLTDALMGALLELAGRSNKIFARGAESALKAVADNCHVTCAHGLGAAEQSAAYVRGPGRGRGCAFSSWRGRSRCCARRSPPRAQRSGRW